MVLLRSGTLVAPGTCTVVSVIMEYPYKTKTKNKPIIQVKLHVRTLSSRNLVPGPGSSSHHAWDLFVVTMGIEVLSLLLSPLGVGGGMSSIPPYR